MNTTNVVFLKLFRLHTLSLGTKKLRLAQKFLPVGKTRPARQHKLQRTVKLPSKTTEMKNSADREPLKVLSHLKFGFFGLSYSGKVYFVTITGKLGLVNESHVGSQVCCVLDRVLAACHLRRLKRFW